MRRSGLRLDRAQPVALYALIACALGTVLSAGLFSTAISVAAIALAAGSIVVPLEARRWLARSHLLSGALLIVFFWLGSQLVLGERELTAGATLFLLAVLLVRLYSERDPQDAGATLLLSLLVVLAGAALSSSLAFAPYFFAFVLTSVWALVTTQLSKEAGDKAATVRISGGFLAATALLAVVIGVQTTAFFVLFPRFGAGVLQIKGANSQAVTGFSDHVDLGGKSQLSPSSTVVLRLEFSTPPPMRPDLLYFRGVTLTRFDGVHWVRTDSPLRPLRASADGLFHLRELYSASAFVLQQEPSSGEAVFLPEGTAAFGFSAAQRLTTPVGKLKFFRAETGDVSSFRATPATTRYDALWSPKGPEPKKEEAPPPDDTSALQLPGDLNPQIVALATEWAGDAALPEQKAQRIAQALGKFPYSTEQLLPPVGRDPLSYFLFDRRAGHCEYFASAEATLLRAVGVPTRLVNGYYGAEYNEYGHYWSVSEAHAHSWVEYWQGGWRRIDPTPSDRGLAEVGRVGKLVDLLRYRWTRYVVDFDLDLQVAALQGASDLIRSQWSRSSKATPAFATPKRVLGFVVRHRTPALLAAAAALSAWLWWLRRKLRTRKASGPARYFERFLAMIRRSGLEPRTEGTPLAAYARELSVAVGSAAPVDFVDTYLAARFGADESAAAALPHLCRQVQLALSAYRRQPQTAKTSLYSSKGDEVLGAQSRARYSSKTP